MEEAFAAAQDRACEPADLTAYLSSCKQALATSTALVGLGGGGLEASVGGASPSPAKKAKRAVPQSPVSRIMQTDAMREYHLTRTDLDKLVPELRPNPHRRGGVPMRLYVLSEVTAAAVAKHGSMDGVAAAKAKGAAQGAKAAATRRWNDGWRVGANPDTWSVATHGSFTPQFKTTVRAFLLAANQLRLFGGADSFAELSQRVISFMVSVVPPRKNQLAKKERPRAAPSRHFSYYGMSDEYDVDGYMDYWYERQGRYAAPGSDYGSD